MTALPSSSLPGADAWPGWCVDRTELVLGLPDHDFEQLFLRHYDEVVRSLTAITGDREIARDCVQEAFVKASTRWRKISRYDDPVAWVRRVAINRSRDVHRSDRRRRRREAAAGAETPTETVAAEHAIDGSVALIELLQQLPPQQRTVAALFYVDDLPVAEVADLLNLSVGAVKFHLSKARATLRTVVEHEGQRDGYRERRNA